MPVAQPVTVVAQVQTGPSLVVSGPSLSLTPGQTIDLGTLSTAGCADPSAPFTLQPQTLNPTPANATDDATTLAPDATAVTTDQPSTDATSSG